MPRWSSQFAGGSTVCRWRSSSPHRALRRSASKALPPAWTTAYDGCQAHSRAALPRHRTMRAVVDWSYGLLSPDEQRFFRALGIFAGGLNVEAAAAVAMDPAK